MTEQYPGGVAGRVIDNLNNERFSDHDNYEESIKVHVHGQWVGAVHMHRELSREARAILAEYLEQAYQANESGDTEQEVMWLRKHIAVERMLFRLGLNMEPEDGDA